jgi:voltage-gated potassium channel
MRDTIAKISRIFLLLLVLVIVGTLGFMLIEGWSFQDSLFMSVITLTTVGFGEVHPLSSSGRYFVIAYLLVGFGTFSFGVVKIAEMVLQTQFKDWMARHKMDTVLKSMRGHFIICGFGRMGRAVCRQLAAKGLPFVAVDKDEAAVAECQQEGWPYLVGDATDDRTLLQAGIDRAQALAAVLPTDADNLYVVLSARLLSKGVQIIARAFDEKGIAKLEKAGANRVVSIYATGAAKMSQLLANPNVEEFLEVITSKGKELGLTEVSVSTGAPYAGQTLAQTSFRKLGIIIVGIRRNGVLILPPASTDLIQIGDCLIALGRAEAIAELAKEA